MKSFVDWVQGGNFWIRQHWDFEKQKLVKRPGKLHLFPHQERILGHCLTADEEGIFPYTTIIYSCPKKGGKTTLLAAIGCWYAECADGGSEIYSLANDLEQAEGRAMREMKYHGDRKELAVQKYRIDYPGGTFIQALSSSYTSAAGAHQSLTLWDELWGFSSERSIRLWEEMTPIPTEASPLQVVATYAGFEGESDLLWELYKSTVINGVRLRDEFPDLPCYRSQEGSVFCYWDHEPRMPWQVPEYYFRQASQLRPQNFLRLHRNEWVSSEDAFIGAELWENAEKLEGPLMYAPDSKYCHYPIYIGVDIGVRHDTSAVVGVYYDYQEKQVGLAFHRIWVPEEGETLDLEDTVELYLKEMYEQFNVMGIWADPTHFYRSITGLTKKRMRVYAFNQTPKNMTAASTALYEQLQYGVLKVYKADDLRDHVRFAKAKTRSSGFSLVKSSESGKPIDGAIALAIAVYHAIGRGGTNVGKPVEILSPFSDKTQYPADARKPEYAVLPEALGGPKDWSGWPESLKPRGKNGR